MLNPSKDIRVYSLPKYAERDNGPMHSTGESNISTDATNMETEGLVGHDWHVPWDSPPKTDPRRVELTRDGDETGEDRSMTQGYSGLSLETSGE